MTCYKTSHLFFYFFAIFSYIFFIYLYFKSKTNLTNKNMKGFDTMRNLITKAKNNSKKLMTGAMVAMYSAPVMATDTSSVPIVGGIQKLLGDVTGWLTMLIPLACGASIAFFALKKSMSDDQSVAQDCNKKMKNTLISGVIGVSAVAIVNFLLTYF